MNTRDIGELSGVGRLPVKTQLEKTFRADLAYEKHDAGQFPI